LIAVLLREKDADWRVRKFIIETLIKISDERAVEPLIALLKHENYNVCQAAANVLGKIGDKRAVEPLIALLSHPCEDYFGPAASALGEIGDQRAVTPLIAALKSESFCVFVPAANALGKIGDQRAVKPLIDTLPHIDTERCEYVAKALIKIGAPALEPLILALKHEHWYVRRSAAKILGEIGDKRAIGPLVARLTDRHSNKTAAESLEKLDWLPRTKMEEIRYLIALQVNDPKNWPQIRAVLLQDIRSGNVQRIEYAMFSFTMIGNDAILPDLVQLIRTKGTKTIAEAYINSNQPQLYQAAADWARRRGYTIKRTYGAAEAWNWGGNR